jgi:hypothetical protein
VSEHLAATIALYAAMLAGWAALGALRRRDAGSLHRAGLGLLETATVVQATIDIVAQIDGHRPLERATHLGYVAASVLILPLALLSSAPTRERGAWDAAIATIACLATLVVALRLRATWGSGDGG